MNIEIISDTVCPWCLVGKRKLEAALKQRPELDVTISWKPFQLNPDAPPEGKDRKTAIAEKFGSLENARQIYDRVGSAGKEVGVDFNFDAIPRTPNTQNSHRLIHWAGQAGVQNAMVEILFRRFFIDGEDIGDKGILLDAAEEADLERDLIASRLDSDLDLQQVLDEDTQARQLGVSGVPFFIFERKYAVSGAQPPEAFLQIFDTIAAEAVETADSETAPAT